MAIYTNPDQPEEHAVNQLEIMNTLLAASMPQRLIKTVTFTGAATMVCGTAVDTDAFIASTTATDIDADEWWTAATPAVGSKSPLVVFTGGIVTSQGQKLLHENIILTIATADVNSGVMEFYALWQPLSSNGNLAAA